MEYPYGWMPDPAYESWGEERLPVESELEMQIWRWALLEAHLWEASQVYESLMGSPFAPRIQGERRQRPRSRRRNQSRSNGFLKVPQ